MALKEQWTVGDMQQELKEVVDSWAAKVPGLNNNKETKQAKEMYHTFAGIIKVVGKDATSDTLSNLKHVDGLRAALAGETTVESVNELVHQFEQMELMHRVVRSRHLQGKPIPQSLESMQAIMQVEGPKFLSKAQRSRIIKQQRAQMMQNIRKKY